MSFLLAILFLMPPHPDIEKRMKEDGSWDNYLRIVEDARKRGMDAPSEELMEKTFMEVQAAKRSKQKVIKRAAVILCDFPDYPATTPPARYDTLLSSTGILPTGSVKEYYAEVSYGIIEFQFVITPVWVRLPQTLTYYANNQYGLGEWPQNAQKMAYDAVLAADPYIDFSQCDMDGDGEIDVLIIIHAGPGAESTGDRNHIWSHAWVIPVNLYVDGVRARDYTTVPENAGCGVVTHELGHRPFGLPDLYDTDGSSEGIGRWCLMAAGSWNGGGNIPAHMSAWCKVRLGFVTVDTVRGNRVFQPIPAVEDSPKVFRLWTNGTTGRRYFLVENRRLKKFDRALPGEGLLIFHVDDAIRDNNNEWYPGRNPLFHYKVALEQADGRWDLEKKVNRGDAGDPWPGSTNNRDFHNYSVPDSKDYGNPMVTTYVGVLNISDPGDVMYADLTVSPYSNLKLTSISTPRADTLNANTEFLFRLFNNGFTQVNTNIKFDVYSEAGDLIYSSIQNIVVDTGSTDTLSFTFQTTLDDHDYSYVIYNSYSDFTYRDDSLKGRLYSKAIERSYQVPRVEGGNYYRPHVVDGIVGEYEYYGADWLDISNFLAVNGEANRTIRGAYMKAHIMNDTLFLGFKLSVDSTLANNDYITIVFDDNGDGNFPQTNSNEGEITFRDGSPRLCYFRPYTASGTGSMLTINLPQAYTLSGGNKYAEIAIPIDLIGSGLSYYLNIPGGYSNFQPRIFVKVTDGTKIVGWWPQNIAYATYVRDLPNFAVLTSSPVGIWEGVHVNKINGAWKNNSFVVKYSGLAEKVHLNITVFNAAGRLIKSENVLISGSGELSFQFKGLQAGVYFVKLVVDGKESGIYKGVFVR